MKRRRLAPVLAVSVMATLAPGLAAAPASAASPLDSYVQQKLAWKRCSPDAPAALQCATLRVPLDYQRPSGPKMNIAISRLKSAVPAKRHGVLLSNPGGPGGSGIAMPLMLNEAMPKSVKEKYDLIGFDPRGVGLSSPLGCGLSDKDMVWPRPYKAKTFTKDTQWAKLVARKCEKYNADTLAHINTANTAQDMDLLRAVLREEKISYLGYSYGTQLGAVYTQMFPSRADRFILDSSVDPKLAWRGMLQVWAEGAEPAFDRWTEWTAKRSATYKLGTTPAAVRKTFWDLVKQVEKKPIVVDGETITADDIRYHLRAEFFTPKTAAAMVVEVKKAAAGKKSTAKRLLGSAEKPGLYTRTTEAVRSSLMPGGIPYDNSDAVFWAVACGDNTAAWPADRMQYAADATRDKARWPLFGDFGSNIKPCASWKPAAPGVTVDNSVPALIIQNEWDSQTPLSTAIGMRQALKGSRLVTVDEGEGHGVYLFGGNACANKAGSAYLLNGKLQANDSTCKAGPSGAARHSADPIAPSPFPQNPNRF
ncbi:alpha/beta hydrolase [Streptomyces sp. CAU 1734]|uniref:alpha/beta hydrolase n=1 Tax=Streptomyces sp. CAU 1734 TaxID=3140360 RepID=UPI00326124E1